MPNGFRADDVESFHFFLVAFDFTQSFWPNRMKEYLSDSCCSVPDTSRCPVSVRAKKLALQAESALDEILRDS